jgi:hypothetical protein
MSNRHKYAAAGALLMTAACNDDIKLKPLEINEPACLYFTDGTASGIRIKEMMRVSPDLTWAQQDFIKAIKVHQGRDLAYTMLQYGKNATPEQRSLPARSGEKAIQRILQAGQIAEAGTMSIKADNDVRCETNPDQFNQRTFEPI